MDEGRYGREWYVFPHRSRPLHPSSVSLTRASSPGGEAFNLPLRGRWLAAGETEEGRYGREWYVFSNRSRPERPSSVRATPCQLPRRGSFLTFPSGEGGSPQARRKRGVTGESGTYFPTALAHYPPPQSGLRPASSPVGEAFFPQGKVKDYRSSKYRSSRSRYRTASSPRGLSVRSRMARL